MNNVEWILRGPRDLIRQEVPLPAEVPVGWVRLVPLRIGICGSDMHLYQGDRQAIPGLRMGHEVVAQVVEGNGTGWNRGDRVVLEPNVPCGRCEVCLRGVGRACPNKMIFGINRPGALARWMDAPPEYLYRIPHEMPVEIAVFVEPLAVAVHAVRTMGELMPGSTVAIIGAGAQGLLLARLLQHQYRVVLIENNPDRIADVKALDPTLECQSEADQTFDYVFETGGTTRSASLALNLIAPGGTLVMVGLAEESVNVSPFTMVRNSLTIRGSIIYDHGVDFLSSIHWLARFGTAGLIPSKVFQFTDVPHAFSALTRGETVKAVIATEGVV